jgi:hypothetical protein
MIAAEIMDVKKTILNSAESPRNAAPSYSEFSFRAAGAASSKPDYNGYLKAKEGKVQTERKILCIEKQMEHHRFVLSLQFFIKGGG